MGLMDGRILCKVANVIQPGIVKKINAGENLGPYKKMENISNFSGACRSLGVLEKNIFSTVDLYEAKNLKGVHQCIADLGQAIRVSAPSFKGPFLGFARKADVTDNARKKGVVNRSEGLRRDIDDEVREANATRGRPF